MSCCGNKRREWVNAEKKSVASKSMETVPAFHSTEKPDKVFEYTGEHSLTIKGTTSGKLYKFRFKGEKIRVDYFDSLAIMAERDLVISFTP